MTSVSFFSCFCSESLRKMPPGVGFWLVFVGSGGGGFELVFARGGGEFAARGVVRLGIDRYISRKRRIIKTFSLNLHISHLDH